MRSARRSMNRYRDALRRIGSGSSVSWFGFWVTLALNGLHHLSGSPGLSGHLAARVAAVLASQVAMFAVLLAARGTVLRDAGVRPAPVATLVTFAVAGAVRSLVLVGLVSQVVAVPTFLKVGSMITGTFIFGSYLALCSYLVSVFGENRHRVTEAAHAQAALVAARAQAQKGLRDQRREAVEVVQADLVAAFDAMAATSQAIDAAQMRTFLNETVRPTSHRLAASIDRWQPPMSQTVDPKMRWRRVYEAVGASTPFSPVIQAGLCAMPAFSTIIAIGPSRFAILLTAAVVAPLAAMTVGNHVIGRLPRTASPRVRIAAVLGWVVGSAAFVALAWAGSLMGTGLSRAGFIYGLFFTVTLSLASAAAKAALTAQRQLQQELQVAQAELRWDLARIHQLQWHQQRLSARALHGPVQSAIIQETMRLSMNASNRSAQDVRASLTAALRSAFTDADAMPSVRTLLASLARSWESLCRVTYCLECDPSALDADDSAKSCLIDTLSETVANAVRHGYASRVTIRVEQESRKALRVEVADDGLGYADSVGTGLGSQMMDDCCLLWERSTSGAGTTVRFVMPVEPCGDVAVEGLAVSRV